MSVLEWGNKYFRFRLSCDDAEAAKFSQRVLSRWVPGSQARDFGLWRLEGSGSGWQISSPEEVRPKLREAGVPSRLERLDEAIKSVEFQALFTALGAPGGPTGFHGALLGKGNRMIGLVGNKEAGKSTLSTYLWSTGYDLYSDDGFQIELEGLSVVPTPRRSRVRAGCREFLGESVWNSIASRSGTYQGRDGSLLFDPAPPAGKELILQAMVLLRAEPGGLESMTEAEAATDLVVLNHLYYSEGLPASLAQTARLSNLLRCFRLGRGSLESRAAMIGRVFEETN